MGDSQRRGPGAAVGRCAGVGRRSVLTFAAAGLLSACTGGSSAGGGLKVSDAPSDVDALDSLTTDGVTQVLASRLAALRAGDANGYLGRLDPANTALFTWQKRLLGNLPRFTFTQLDYRLAPSTSVIPDKDGTYLVPVVHVLQTDADSGPPDVVPGEPYQYRFARRNGRWMIVDITPDGRGMYGALALEACQAPWNLDDLQVAHSGKITVAAPGAVPELQRYAEVASREATRIARVWGDRTTFPGAVIFLAPDEATMGRWYRASVSTPLYAKADGLTIAFSRQGYRKGGEPYSGESVSSRITVNLGHLIARGSEATDVARLMRHELVHALTGPIYSASDSPSRWAIEGFARFFETERLAPASAAVVAAGVRAGWFTGTVPDTKTFYTDRIGFNYDLSASLFAFIAAAKGLPAAVEFYAQAAALSELGESVMATPRMDSVSKALMGMGSRQLLAKWGGYVRSL